MEKEQEKFQCSWCNEYFYDLSQLRNHYKDNHNINEIYRPFDKCQNKYLN